MATLVGNVDSEADVVWTLSDDVPDATEYFQVDDEIVQVLANFPSSVYAPTQEVTPPKIRVRRGAGGTTAASHSNGATLTPVIPPSTGTGGDPGEQTVYVQATDLSAAEIAALSSVPVEVVAAPGADKMVVVVGAAIHFVPGTEPFGGDPALALVVGDPDEDHRLLGLTELGLVQTAAARAFQMQHFFESAFVGQPVAEVENQPISLVAATGIGFTGSILTSIIGDAGTGYAEDDEITFEDGAALVVDTVDGGGEVLTYHITAVGSGYPAGTTLDQETTDGGGVDFALEVATITPLSDGTARLTVAYYVMDLLP